MNDKLKRAIEHRNKNEYDESEKLFVELIAEHPNNGQTFYHYAWLMDKQGKEESAAPKYKKAIELGLANEDLLGCYTGLGSTYRNIGELEKSLALFKIAIEKFPNDPHLKLFMAFTMHDLGQTKEALSMTIESFVDTSSDLGIQRYKKALLYYSQNLE